MSLRVARTGLALLVLAACDEATAPEEPPVAAVRIETPGASTTLQVGDTLRLAAAALDVEGKVLRSARVDWNTTDSAVVTVDASGLVTGRSSGSAFVRAASGAVTDSLLIRVAHPLGVGLHVLAPASIRQGDVATFTAIRVRDDGGVDTLRSGVDWQLVEPDVGELDARGRLVGYAAGQIVHVVAAAVGEADTVQVQIRPRGLSGRFSVLGRGPVNERFTSDLWVWRSPADGRDYALTGTWACRGNSKGGQVCGNRVSVWNVAEPGRPTLTDSLLFYTAADRGQTINDVKISPDARFAVVTHELIGPDNGITILDIGDGRAGGTAARPKTIVHYTTGIQNGVHNVWIERIGGRDYVFVVEDPGASAHGLHILDVTDLAKPVEVATYYDGSSFLHDVYVRDGLAFLSHWAAGLVILDVGNGIRGGSPSNPVVVSRTVIPGFALHNAWYWPAGKYIFLGDERHGGGQLRVLDASDLTHPVPVAQFLSAAEVPHNYWLDENRAILFAAWYSEGVRAIDVSGELIGRLDRQGRQYAAVVPAPTGGASLARRSATTPERTAASALAHPDDDGHGSDSCGNATPPGCIWAPQLHNGRIFASDMEYGLWSFEFQIP